MMTIEKTIVIPMGCARKRLDQTLAELLPEFSRTKLKEWLMEGAIRVNGQVVKPRFSVNGGEVVTLKAILAVQAAVWQPEPIPLNVVYEDEHLIVINKPAGMVVHPAAGNSNQTLLNALLYHAPSLHLLPRAGIIHRLDKLTSGILVIAKTLLAYQHLTRQLKARKITREYQAVASGLLLSGGTIDAPIGRHPLQRKRMAIIETGKQAISHYRVIKRFRAHTLVSVNLETGRTHQIRVHFAHIRHALLGDITYGGSLKLPKGATPPLVSELRTFNRQALHAHRLVFNHPVTAESVSFCVEMPEDMQQLLKVLACDHEKACLP